MPWDFRKVSISFGHFMFVSPKEPLYDFCFTEGTLNVSRSKKIKLNLFEMNYLADIVFFCAVSLTDG